MNKLKFGQTGGYPLRWDRLIFQHQAYFDAFKNIIKPFLKEEGPNNGVVLWGCNIVDLDGGEYSVSEGAVTFGGEVWPVPEHIVTVSSAPFKAVYFRRKVENDPTSIRQFNSGQNHPTQELRYSVIEFVVFNNGNDLLNTVQNNPNNEFLINFNPATGFSFPRVKDVIFGEWRKLPYNSAGGWAAAPGDILYRKDMGGMVQITGNKSPQPTEVNNALVGTLPAGFRPAYDVVRFWGWRPVQGGGQQAVYIKIGIDGTCRLVNEAGAVAVAIGGEFEAMYRAD